MMWLCHEAPVTAPLSHSQLQISISKHNCLSLHSSVRKLLWSPGAENASKNDLQILNPSKEKKKKKIQRRKRKDTVWLLLAYKNNNDNNLEIAGGSSTLHAKSIRSVHNCV